MNKKQKDEALAANIAGVMNYHRTMLSDGVRNKLICKAIEQAVGPGTSFLDVGAGTGAWAILAAKLGAKRVVAVEMEECLIPFIYKHAQENGVADRIEIIHGKSDDAKIRGRFDVIVSELFGSGAFGPETVNSFLDLRKRFLAPSGILIPQKLSLLAIPVRFERSAQLIPSGLPLSCEFMRSMSLNYPQSTFVGEKGAVKPLGAPRTILDMDFVSIDEAPTLTGLTASWDLSRLNSINAIATTAFSTFTPGIKMNSMRSQSWSTTIYEFKPFEAERGKLEFSVSLAGNNTHWTVESPGSDEKSRAYSPVFAFTRVRMAQKATPHRRVRPTKRERQEQEKGSGVAG